MTDSKTIVRPPISTFRQILLSFFWFSTNMMWAAMMLIIMPNQVIAAVGDATKGTVLGVVLAIGAFISLVAAPIFGALSDRIKLPGGRRKPWVVIGTAGNVIGLVGMAYLLQPNHPETVFIWTAMFIIVQLFNNLATAPYTALIPDLVSPEQRGSASGWMGLMTLLGNIAGAATGFLIAPLGIANIYFVMIGVLILGAVVTWFGIDEFSVAFEVPPFNRVEFFKIILAIPALFVWAIIQVLFLFKVFDKTKLPKWIAVIRETAQPYIDPFTTSDFTWVLMTRLLVLMGFSIVQAFINFYMRDVIGSPFVLFGVKLADTADDAVSFFGLALLVGAAITTVFAGTLSDKYGRKRMVYLSGALMGIVCFVFILFHSFTLAVLMGIIFGLGYGAYTSVDWALVSDVLPSMDDYAKDMGIWHVADVLPQVIAGAVGGVLLDNFQRIGAANHIQNLGYITIFFVSVLFFLLGTVFVAKIKGVR
jgi:MFS family permease